MKSGSAFCSFIAATALNNCEEGVHAQIISSGLPLSPQISTCMSVAQKKVPRSDAEQKQIWEMNSTTQSVNFIRPCILLRSLKIENLLTSATTNYFILNSNVISNLYCNVSRVLSDS